MKKGIFILLIIPLLFWGCPEIEQVSPIPEIEFLSFNFYTFYDTLGNANRAGILEFKFIDGDADLGVLMSVDTSKALPDSVKHGIFLQLFEKVDGNYYERFPTQLVHTKDTTIIKDTILNEDIYIIKDSTYLDTLSFNLYLPYDDKLNRIGQNKTVKGIIRARVLFEIKPPYDTMRFEFFIRDRALNKSNVEYTPDFTVDFSEISSDNSF